jgi:methyl-accepting chemotaxis protein
MKTTARLVTFLGKLSVGQQLLGAFGTLLVLMVLLGAVALVAMSRMDQRVDALHSRWLVAIDQLTAARTALVEARDVEVKHSRTGDKSYHSEYEEKFAEAAKIVGARLDAYKALEADADEAKLRDRLLASWAAYTRFAQQVMKLGRDKQQQDAADISDGAASMANDEAMGALRQALETSFNGAKGAAGEAGAAYQKARTIALAVLGLGLALGLVLASVITRSLVGQLGGQPATAAAVARAVAEGNLASRIPVKAGDRTSLMASLQAMQGGLADAVRQVRQGSESVATASAQIADGNQDLSGRTEQQAAALQQTTATIATLDQTVQHNAESARQANQLAEGAAGVAQQGGEVVGQVVHTMRAINDSSRRIADIIGVIDGIAFQTNILALNAAVEAARAGEQGRGFAVVAGEVRSLAQRSAAAAKEIKSLITSSVEQVDKGSALVDQAGKTMDDIVRSIRQVSDVVAGISSASAEQSAGMKQVSQAVQQMDQATQQNAALVEQSAAAAESLRQQAQQLVQAVSVFSLAQA